MITVSHQSELATITFADGKVNAMDIEWCRTFTQQLKELEGNSRTRAVIVASGERVFSAGVDLKRVIAEDPDYVQPFIDELAHCFRTAFAFSKPMVAAVGGHAIAGGCIVASCADFRIATPRARIGLPELRLGVPLPAIAVEVIRRVALPSAFQMMLNSGANYRDQAAVDAGLADRIVNKEALMEQAAGHATQLAAIPLSTFRVMKQQIRHDSLDRADELERKFGSEVRRIWNSPEIRDTITQYVAKM